MSKRRGRLLTVAAVAALAGALAIWVVPAFSGGAANEWTWVSGLVISDNGTGTTALTAYNDSSAPQQVTVSALNSNGTAATPLSPTTVTVPAGGISGWAWDCGVSLGCSRVYTLHTQSADVVASLAYDVIDSPGLTYAGLEPPGGFQVFGPNQLSTAATAQTISNASALIQAEIGDLQDKTADLQDKTSALQGDTNELKSDTATLKTGNKKLKKQLKKVLKAVR